MGRSTCIALSLLSAGLYACLYPPIEAAPLAWLALVPLFAVFLHARPLVAAAAGLCFASVATLGVGWWLPGMLEHYFAVPRPAAWGGFLAVSVLIDGLPYAALGAWVAWAAQRGERPLAPAIGAAFVLAEWLRASGPVANPYALLAYSQQGTPFAQLADIAGPWGIGWLVASANAALATLLLPGARVRPLWNTAAIAAGVAAAWVYGTLQLAQPTASEAPVRIAVVQTGMGPERHAPEPARGERLAQTLALTRTAAAAQPDLVFWPEHAVDFYLNQATPERAALFASVNALGVELVLGAPDVRADGAGPHYFNSVFLLDGGGLRGRSDKVHLVPFAEYGPFGPRWRAETALFEPGVSPTPLHSRAAIIGAFLCGELLHPQVSMQLVRDGAELLANPSIDTWLREPAAALGLVRIAAFRAIESRRYVVRATPTGYSAVIDPFGRVTALSRFGGADLLTATVQRSQRVTLYQRFGDFACGAALLVVAFFSLEAGLFSRRRRSFA